jgi:acyl carrier protein
LHQARRLRPLLARLGHDVPEMTTSAVTQTQEQTEPALTTRLARAPEPLRHEILVAYLRQEVAAVLGVKDHEDVSVNSGLFELGMDSLMSVELRRRLERGAGRKLPSTLTFNYPSIAALATFLHRELVVPEEPGARASQGNAVAPVNANDDLDLLSDEQLEAKLLARLESVR